MCRISEGIKNIFHTTKKHFLTFFHIQSQMLKVIESVVGEIYYFIASNLPVQCSHVLVLTEKGNIEKRFDWIESSCGEDCTGYVENYAP